MQYVFNKLLLLLLRILVPWLLDPLQIKISRAPYPPMHIQMQEEADGNHTIDVYCEHVILKSQNF